METYSFQIWLIFTGVGDWRKWTKPGANKGPVPEDEQEMAPGQI